MKCADCGAETYVTYTSYGSEWPSVYAYIHRYDWANDSDSEFVEQMEL